MPAIQNRGRKPVLAKQPVVAKELDRSRYFSRAVGKALEILELVERSSAPLALHEIARAIRLSKTSALRLVCTLEASGYVVATTAGTYRLVPALCRAVSTQFIMRLLRASTPVMQDLSRDLRETISVAALFENRVEVIAVVESQEILRMGNVVGHILPPNASSLGKVIAAFQSDERREKLLRSLGLYRYTPNTITDSRELDQEFARIREQGSAADREESIGDGYCFAVPIIDDAGEVPAGISVSLPKFRYRDTTQEEEFIAALRAAALRIAAGISTF
jgi:DNA-binding IclR family transcriptional regulator